MTCLASSLYNLALIPAAVLLGPWALLSPKRRAALPGRLGLTLPQFPPGGLWVHALSVGEVISSRPLLAELRRVRPDLKLWLSASTATGLALARQEVAAKRADACLAFPWDLAWVVNRFLNRVRPAGVIIVETDVWPNFVRACQKRSLPAALVNFRISPARHRGHKRLAWFFKAVYAQLSAVALPTQLDLERFEELGLDSRVLCEVTGSLKYDQPQPEPARPEDFGLEPGRLVLAAGSTHPGEEEIVLAAWLQLRAEWPDLALILAPRDTDRFEEAARKIRAVGFEPARLSRGERLSPGRPVLLVDQLGRLSALYALAQVAFVGGSLVDRGGHNVLEPAALGRPVLFGPHMDNFWAEAQRLLASGGGTMVRDRADLVRAMRQLLADPHKARAQGQAARQTFVSHQGAAARVVALVGRACRW
ncbi:MAG: 3-deoxy-D-manno-octulosonic acid transferase [Deltaproteobacteria bacterium]|nr:3-deoxy-D-manno-octulosonic acid transferase [Deltaproteobacteria bacterium]